MFHDAEPSLALRGPPFQKHTPAKTIIVKIQSSKMQLAKVQEIYGTLHEKRLKPLAVATPPHLPLECQTTGKLPGIES